MTGALGEAADYDGLLALLRARQTVLGLTNEQLEALTGLQPGYISKLHGQARSRSLGGLSFGLLCQGLAIKVAIVEDVEAAKKMAPRWDQRERPVPQLAMASFPVARWLFTTRKGRRMAQKRAKKLSPARRTAIARKAGKARAKRARDRKRARSAIQPSTPLAVEPSSADFGGA